MREYIPNNICTEEVSAEEAHQLNSNRKNNTKLRAMYDLRKVFWILEGRPFIFS